MSRSLSVAFFLLAGVMLVLLMGTACAAPKRASNVMDWLSARDNTFGFRNLLARFPYWQQLLADPEFVGTVFVPLGTSFPWVLTPGHTVELGGFEPSLTRDNYRREFFYTECAWRGLNQHFVLGKALGNKDFVDGAKFDTPLEHINPLFAFPDYNRNAIVRNSSGTYVGSTFYMQEMDPPPLFKIRGSAAVGQAMVHLIKGNLFAGCDDDGYTDFVNTFFPPSARSNETAVAQLDYPLVTGPWRDFMQPTLTMLRPSEQALNDYFAANQAAGRQPASPEELFTDSDLTRRFIDAHLVGGRRLWLWDFMNMGVLGQGQAQFSTMGGKAYNVMLAQDKATGKHKVLLHSPGSNKSITLQSIGEPGGRMWASHLCTSPACDGSTQSGSALEVDAVLL